MTIAEALPAATVVLVRDGEDSLETLLLLRSRKLGFHGGEWVFPGGRVDVTDAGDDDRTSEPAARRAAAREALEEAGVSLAPDSFVSLAHWTTPIVLPKRFATYFFLARSPSDEISVDGGEIEAHRWMRPADAIRARDAGELGLPPPTFVTLTELSAFRRVDDALAAFAERDTPWLLPRVTLLDSTTINLLPGDAGYEVARHDVPGARHRVVMAPSGWRYERP